MTAKIKPNTQIIGQNLVYFARLDSTNHLAMEMYKNQLIENGTVIYTDEQTQGRGQLQREWQSAPYENLLFSILLKPVTNTLTNPFTLNKCITLGICQFLKEQLPNEKVCIKWPNDLMVNKKKIAGVLIENSFSGHQLNASVVGIGLNVNQHFSDQAPIKATSFFDLKNEVSDRWALFQQLLETIDNTYISLIRGEVKSIEQDFDQVLLGYHEIETFEMEGQRILARLEGCDSEGGLVISQNNELKAYQHGNIKQIIEA